MHQGNWLGDFRKQWASFLREREQKVLGARGPGCVVQSHDDAGHRYRWILLVAHGRRRDLTSEDQETIEHHFARGVRQKQKVYLVVRFGDGINKVLILPAEQVRKRKRILARKGGIPWND